MNQNLNNLLLFTFSKCEYLFIYLCFYDFMISLPNFRSDHPYFNLDRTFLTMRPFAFAPQRTDLRKNPFLT